MSRLLIVNADDYGLSRGISRGILRAHADGIVTSTSVMANGPAFAEAARWLGDAPALGIGVHLAAVGEDPPLLDAREIPTLCDAHGRLPRSWRELSARILIGIVDPADLEREFGAQIERVRACRQPTHLDTHQHVHLWPLVGDVVIALARKFGIGAIRVPRSALGRVAGPGVSAFAWMLARKAALAGLAFVDAFAGFDEAGRMEWPRLERTICRLGRRRPAAAEICVHPGLAEDGDRDRYRWGYRWSEELAALCAPATRHAIRLAGFELGTYAELRADTRAA